MNPLQYLTDETGRRVAAVVEYQDWLEIERQLETEPIQSRANPTLQDSELTKMLIRHVFFDEPLNLNP